MINNLYRIGNFTSSEIVALTTSDKAKGFGKPALTYIKETNWERRLGRSITDEVNAKPLTWGKLVEKRIFELMGLEYVLTSSETTLHPTINYWAGSKDGIKYDPGKTVLDYKAPMTLTSFCGLVEPLYKGLTGMDAMDDIRENHKDGEKYFWQLVSNSIIEDTKYAELIIYMPYKSELDAIKLMAQQVSGEQQSKHYWIAMALDGELPFILDGGYYNNINVIRFEVSKEDKDFLTDRVTRAGEKLIPRDGETITPKNKDVPVNTGNELIV